jgi:hypothetical protein
LNTDRLTAEKLAALADSGTEYGRNPVGAAFLLDRLSTTFGVRDERGQEAIPTLMVRVQARMTAWHAPGRSTPTVRARPSLPSPYKDSPKPAEPEPKRV